MLRQNETSRELRSEVHYFSQVCSECLDRNVSHFCFLASSLLSEINIKAHVKHPLTVVMLDFVPSPFTFILSFFRMEPHCNTEDCEENKINETDTR